MRTQVRHPVEGKRYSWLQAIAADIPEATFPAVVSARVWGSWRLSGTTCLLSLTLRVCPTDLLRDHGFGSFIQTCARAFWVFQATTPGKVNVLVVVRVKS